MLAFGVFPLFLPLAITAFGGPEVYFSLAIIAFAAFEFIVTKYYSCLGKMEIKVSGLLNFKVVRVFKVQGCFKAKHLRTKGSHCRAGDGKRGSIWKRVGLFYLRVSPFFFYLRLVFVAYGQLAWSLLLTGEIRFGLFCLR